MGKTLQGKSHNASDKCLPITQRIFVKKFAWSADLQDDVRGWTKKAVQSWLPIDVMHWQMSVAKAHNFSYERLKMNRFNVKGSDLLTMPETEFVRRSSEFGPVLYANLMAVSGRRTVGRPLTVGARETEDRLPAVGARETEERLPAVGATETEGRLPAVGARETEERLPAVGATETEGSMGARERDEGQQTVVGARETGSAEAVKRPRGRPVGSSRGKVTKPKTKHCRLWEFLLALLATPEYNPSVIEWEDQSEGLFRIRQSDKLADLWGRSRGKSNMDYVKLSRLMRYYYKNKELQSEKQRLVYRFGPNATGWRTATKPAKT